VQVACVLVPKHAAPVQYINYINPTEVLPNAARKSRFFFDERDGDILFCEDAHLQAHYLEAENVGEAMENSDVTTQAFLRFANALIDAEQPTKTYAGISVIEQMTASGNFGHFNAWVKDAWDGERFELPQELVKKALEIESIARTRPSTAAYLACE
jgi:hypothetical protein